MHKPERTERFRERDLDDEYVFFDAEGDRVHVLNATARRIYLLCDGTRTEEEIARVLCEEYEVDEATAKADVQRTVGELRCLGLVT